jgi:hypothetical protein
MYKRITKSGIRKKPLRGASKQTKENCELYNRLAEFEDELEKKQNENKICHCYHTKMERCHRYDSFTGEPIPMEREVGICWGTREQDQCKCGGDRKKCDFYGED